MCGQCAIALAASVAATLRWYMRQPKLFLFVSLVLYSGVSVVKLWHAVRQAAGLVNCLFWPVQATAAISQKASQASPQVSGFMSLLFSSPPVGPACGQCSVALAALPAAAPAW